MLRDNFIPDFIEILTDVPNVHNVESNHCGWTEVKDYFNKHRVLVLDKDLKTKWIIPKVVSKVPYNGRLIEVESDSCTMYFKPSSFVLSGDGVKKSKELDRKDNLTRRYFYQKVEKIKDGMWEGNMYALFFGEPCYLPVRFERDYCLMPV